MSDIPSQIIKNNDVTIKVCPNWLKDSLYNIEESVSLKAAELIQKGNQLRLRKHIQQLSPHKTQQSNKQSITSRIVKLKRQQQILRDKLKEISHQQNDLKGSRNLTVKLSKPDSNRKLKLLTKNFRQFKLKLEQKTKFLELEEQQYKLSILRLEEEKKKTQGEERRHEIQVKLKNIQQSRQRVAKKTKYQRQILKRLANKKLYEKMAEEFNHQENSTTIEKYESFKDMKNLLSVNFDEVRDHEQQYQFLLAQKQLQRMNKLQESRLQLPTLSHYKSQFYQQIVQEQKNRFKKQEQEIQKKKMLHQKHKQYQKFVLSEYAPNVKPLELNHNGKTFRKQALNKQDLTKLGNQYYSVGQSRAKACNNQPSKHATIANSTYQDTKRSYPDYLPAILKENNVESAKKNLKARYLKKIEYIIADSSRSHSDKIEQINMYTGQMYKEDEFSHLNDSKMIEKVRTKLEILNMIR